MNTEKLYNALVNEDLLSISFDEFQNKLQDDSYKSKVHQTIIFSIRGAFWPRAS